MGKTICSPSPRVLAAIHELGQLLQVARKRRRLTQKQLAERAGLGRVTVAKAEAGHSGLAVGALLEILMVLDRDMVRSVVATVRTDPLGELLERQRLPARVVNKDDF